MVQFTNDQYQLSRHCGLALILPSLTSNPGKSLVSTLEKGATSRGYSEYDRSQKAFISIKQSSKGNSQQGGFGSSHAIPSSRYIIKFKEMRSTRDFFPEFFKTRGKKTGFLLNG